MATAPTKLEPTMREQDEMVTPDDLKRAQEERDERKRAAAEEKAYNKAAANSDEPNMPFQKKMAKGGSVASKRADGCAVRGKTKGRMV